MTRWVRLVAPGCGPDLAGNLRRVRSYRTLLGGDGGRYRGAGDLAGRAVECLTTVGYIVILTARAWRASRAGGPGGGFYLADPGDVAPVAASRRRQEEHGKAWTMLCMMSL